MSTTPPPSPYDNADRPEGSTPDQPATDPFAQPPAGQAPPGSTTPRLPCRGAARLSADADAASVPVRGCERGCRPATPPSSLLTAVRLMYVGAALSAIFLILGLTQADSLRDQIADNQPELTADELDVAVAVGTAFAVIIGLISVGLWIWMAVMNRKGRSWARVVATVLGGLNIVFTLIGLTQNTGIGTIVNVSRSSWLRPSCGCSTDPSPALTTPRCRDRPADQHGDDHPGRLCGGPSSDVVDEALAVGIAAVATPGGAELGQDVRHVHAGGLGADEQSLADLAVAAAGRDQPQDLEFARGQTTAAVRRAADPSSSLMWARLARSSTHRRTRRAPSRSANAPPHGAARWRPRDHRWPANAAPRR